MKIRMTGETASWIHGTSTPLTASVPHGTGAATITLGTTQEPGHILTGDTIHGTMTLGITADSMILGTTASDMRDIGDGMIHGITCIRIMQDGTADGTIRIGDTITTIIRGTDLAISLTMTTDREYIPALVTAQDPTECLPEVRHSEEAVP